MAAPTTAKPMPLRRQSAAGERDALIAALDGRHVKAGPSGAPARGRTDVLPTGRNLFTADPRTMPTPTAFDLGKAAADEVMRSYLQSHGDWPRSLVIDLWGSASLRTGGEEIAQGLALMGCRPQWDAATGRVTGIEVLPPAALGRPRVDVTWRISGLFRDMFPTQIALIDAAARAVATRDEDDSENPLAASARAAGKVEPRIFGSSPGTYGAGLEDLLVQRRLAARAKNSAAPISTQPRTPMAAPRAKAFPRRVPLPAASPKPTCSSTPATTPAATSSKARPTSPSSAAFRQPLPHSARTPTSSCSTRRTRKSRARARSTEAVGRVVRARATNARFIEGQMRHGPRGASEFAETVDRLIGFAETTNAIPGALIEAVHDAYVGDDAVRAFMLRENPAAAKFIAERFAIRPPAWPVASAAQFDRRRSRRPDRRSRGKGGGGMNAFSRRGACPALSAPMQTGDGLLVRLNPVAGGLSPKALIGLCESALRHGNGIVEVTARGSLQIRGLTAESAALLAAEVDALGIAVRTGVPVDTGPLAGIDPAEIADPRPLAEAIRDGNCRGRPRRTARAEGLRGGRRRRPDRSWRRDGATCGWSRSNALALAAVRRLAGDEMDVLRRSRRATCRCRCGACAATLDMLSHSVADICGARRRAR